MTSDEQFEKWWATVAEGRSLYPTLKGYAEKGWHARDDEIAALEARVNEMEGQITEAREEDRSHVFVEGFSTGCSVCGRNWASHPSRKERE